MASSVGLIGIAIIYSGGERYFWRISNLLHYAFDTVLVACVAILLLAPKRGRDWLSPMPYLIFVVAYYAWGVVVSISPSSVWMDALSQVVLNALILSLIALAISRREGVGRLALYVQIAVLINVVVAVVQFVDWHVLATMARFLNPATLSYNIDRPAGLWVDPNLAGISYLFAFLFSLWAVGPVQLIWAGRVGAIVGIYFTGSRGAMYPLLLCLVVFLAVRGRTWTLSRLHITIISGGAAAIAIAISLAVAGWVNLNSIPDAYALRRFLDASLRGISDPSRFQVFSYWFPRALNGPWYGAGVFSFQGNGRSVEGAHDIFITVWGETGVVMLGIYVIVLGIGVAYLARRHISQRDRLLLLLVWAIYLVEGFAWHNQFSAVEGIVVIGLLYRMPLALKAHRNSEILQIGEGAG